MSLIRSVNNDLKCGQFAPAGGGQFAPAGGGQFAPAGGCKY